LVVTGLEKVTPSISVSWEFLGLGLFGTLSGEWEAAAVSVNGSQINGSQINDADMAVGIEETKCLLRRRMVILA
jgi:hypothetical protein